MSTNNLFIRFANGGSAEYTIDIRSGLIQFQDDYLSYLDSGKPPIKPRKYEVKQGDTKLFLVIDFSLIASVSILDDGGRPA
jgi:hypothetical protein